MPDPDNIPSEGQFLYQHKKFLDACWNNGDRPIYVLVGVPTSDEVWYQHVCDLKSTDPNIAKIVKFWEAAFPEMVKQTGDHPAVLRLRGFPNPSFPNGTWDEEGFGLHSIALNGRQASEVYGVQPWNPGGNTKPDKLTARTALVDALLNAYRNAETVRGRTR